jgi:hypothetical protein
MAYQFNHTLHNLDMFYTCTFLLCSGMCSCIPGDKEENTILFFIEFRYVLHMHFSPMFGYVFLHTWGQGREHNSLFY